jgi:hypothetical protein
VFYTCPCCGYRTLPEPAGSYEICPVCFWEDDGLQLAFPNLDGGANRVSLIEGQKNFLMHGVCEPAMKQHVREPAKNEQRDASWEPYDPERHHALDWDSKSDHNLWEKVKNESPNLYYWQPEFWRGNRS